MSAERRSRTPSTPATEAGAARLVALSHDLMGAVDERGRLVWTNPAWERVLGWPPGALGGSFYLDWLHPDDRAGAAEARRALSEGAGEWPEIEVRVRTRTGDHRWVLYSAVLARDERLVYLCGKDVSARNEAVAERALTHARYKALVSNLPDTVITLFDTDLRILVTEGGQLARRGLDPSAYDGMSVSQTVPAEHHDGMERRLRAALTGEPQAFDLETPDGSTIYRTQVVALRDDDGAVLGGLMVSRDVTERRSRSAPSPRAPPSWSAPTPSSRSSPTSPRTTSPSRCAWSPATCSSCTAATTAGSTRTPTRSSATRWTARRGCGPLSRTCSP